MDGQMDERTCDTAQLKTDRDLSAHFSVQPSLGLALPWPLQCLTQSRPLLVGHLVVKLMSLNPLNSRSSTLNIAA